MELNSQENPSHTIEDQPRSHKLEHFKAIQEI